MIVDVVQAECILRFWAACPQCPRCQCAAIRKWQSGDPINKLPLNDAEVQACMRVLQIHAPAVYAEILSLAPGVAARCSAES